ncbi:helix-turn-helix transcriptional regulator [Streptomyces hebeiensis]|uniref:Helix-turn-helix transcriptional regulator n=1 Tax=Streptomyces hebeiensis TaxID=229486 RepID=A0ABN1UR98_9ACTN
MATSRQKKQRAKRDDLPGIWVGYGKLVKLHRERVQLTQQQLADALGYSVEQIASIEQGRRPAKSAFTTAAEGVLDARGTLEVLQDDVDLAKLPAFFQDFARIEVEAICRYDFEPLLIPGLLQTEDYARALFRGHCPSLDDDTVEQNVEARLSRQKLLTRTPKAELCFIISEPALTSLLGSTEVMRAQLLHLLEQGSASNVEIQVMPATRDFHLGLNGPMVVLETTEHRHVGYIESQGVGIVITDAAKVSAFGLRYGKLRTQALNTRESARLIERLAGEL